MLFNIFAKLFPRATADQLVATKDATRLKSYNYTTITQLGRFNVEIENKNKCQKCIFFVVPGDAEVL